MKKARKYRGLELTESWAKLKKLKVYYSFEGQIEKDS